MFDDESQGLTVLEYLVAHGSERVIDDIREHAYQISVSFFLLVKFVTLTRLPTLWNLGKTIKYCLNLLFAQTLSDFQYIDSSGRDQGSNVRKKSQSLVVLVNDKERIQEVRQKAAANRDK